MKFKRCLALAVASLPFLVSCSGSKCGGGGEQASCGAGGNEGGAPGAAGSGGSSGGNTAGGKGGGGGSGGTGGATGGSGGATGGTGGNAGSTGGSAGGTAGGTAGAGGVASGVCPVQAQWPDPLPPEGAQRKARQIAANLGGQTEGPVWVASKGVLLFTQFEGTGTQGTIRRLTPPTTVDTWVMTVGVNGLALDIDGNVLGAAHDVQWISKFNVETKARTNLPEPSDYMGLPFKSVNDLTVRSDGNIYFSDPTWQQGDRPGQAGTSFYRRAPNGTITRLFDGKQPNGVALSPDQNILYLGDESGQMKKIGLKPDGSIDGAPMDFGNNVGWTDGLAVDCAGNVYVTGGSGVHVLGPPNGTDRGTITVEGTTTSNAAFGGTDRKTLYITGNGRLHEMKLNVPGFPY